MTLQIDHEVASRTCEIQMAENSRRTRSSADIRFAGTGRLRASGNVSIAEIALMVDRRHRKQAQEIGLIRPPTIARSSQRSLNPAAHRTACIASPVGPANQHRSIR